MKQVIRLILILWALLLAVALANCAGGDDSETEPLGFSAPASTAAPAPQSAAFTAADGKSVAREVASAPQATPTPAQPSHGGGTDG